MKQDQEINEEKACCIIQHFGDGATMWQNRAISVRVEGISAVPDWDYNFYRIFLVETGSLYNNRMFNLPTSYKERGTYVFLIYKIQTNITIFKCCVFVSSQMLEK